MTDELRIVVGYESDAKVGVVTPAMLRVVHGCYEIAFERREQQLVLPFDDALLLRDILTIAIDQAAIERAGGDK